MALPVIEQSAADSLRTLAGPMLLPGRRLPSSALFALVAGRGMASAAGRRMLSPTKVSHSPLASLESGGASLLLTCGDVGTDQRQPVLEVCRAGKVF